MYLHDTIQSFYSIDKHSNISESLHRQNESFLAGVEFRKEHVLQAQDNLVDCEVARAQASAVVAVST